MADEKDPTEIGPGVPLTEKNYAQHVAAVPGIFGDTDTTGTAGPGVEVPTAKEEHAGTVVEEADAETGSEVAAARRQLDAQGRGETAEEVDAAAEEQDAEAGNDGSDEEADDDKTAAEVVDEINAASTVEEVDALAEGDERVTVQRAADKKRDELSSNDE